MTLSEAKKRANQKWDKANMTVFSVKITNKIANVLNKAVQDKQTSRNAYVKNAILEALKKDGYCVDLTNNTDKQDV